jgi:ATP phosphoribosyltransferase
MSKSIINGDSRLRLAIQRNGRLTDDTLMLLRLIGLEFESYGQKLLSRCRNFPLSILYGRDDDIPGYVGLGTADLGIVGRNLIYEEGADVVELTALGFGYCSLVIAVLRDSPYQTIDDVKAVKIASSYPNSARRFFAGHGAAPEVISISGSVEMAPSLGLSEAIVELTATGSTLLLNDLRQIHTILESQAVLVANPAAMADPVKRTEIDRLMLRIGARGNQSGRAGFEVADRDSTGTGRLGGHPHGDRRRGLLGLHRETAGGWRLRNSRLPARQTTALVPAPRRS